MVAAVTKFGVGIGAWLLAASCTPAAPTAVAPTLDIPRIGEDAGTGQQGPHFVRQPARLGARTRISVSAVSHSPDAQGTQISSYESELIAEVLAVEGAATTEVRVHFDRNTYAMQGADMPTPIDGKSYVVGTKAPFVRDENGATAPAEQAERVLDVFPDLGTRTRIDEALPDGALVVGERRDEVARAVLCIIHPRAWSEDTTQATLARIEGEDAVYALVVAAHSTNGTKLDTKGEARVRLRGAALVSIALEGSYYVGEKADGTFTYKRTITDE